MEGVAGGDHHRPARDLARRQPVRVAAAVVALVRRADQRRDRGEEGDPLQHAGADRGVLVHPGALLGGQRTGLAEDLGGDRDLADVVEEGAVAEAVELDPLDPHPLADPDRQLGDLLGVVGGVGVLHLDRVGDHPDRGEEGVLEFADQLAAVDRGADLAGDDVGEQQVFLVEGAALALFQVQHAPVGLGDDDRQRELRAGVAAVVAAEVVGVAARCR